VELDQKVYTWTDKVYITIVAPDHNFDSNLIDEIGESAEDKSRLQLEEMILNHTNWLRQVLTLASLQVK
jgi:exoribonuclease R